MAITGLYFVPEASTNNASTSPPLTLSTLADRLTKDYRPTPAGRWTLEHRLLRETVPLPRFLQILSLSHHPGRTFLNITPPPTTSATQGQSQSSSPTVKAPQEKEQGLASAIVAIPAPSQSDEYCHLLTTKMGPLWTFRQTITVNNGLTFDLEDFRIRLGEVKQGQAALTRGLVIEVEWLADSPAELGHSPWGLGEMAIRGIWDTLGLKDGREYLKVAGVEDNPHSLDIARQYCELLRLRQ
ncbi:MAG: hypothetical protein M1817_004612 [Caeruleum heppii]|nr:MAG: hypothetical protein M1817_004612 [Caeruleum heppii]